MAAARMAADRKRFDFNENKSTVSGQIRSNHADNFTGAPINRACNMIIITDRMMIVMVDMINITTDMINTISDKMIYIV